LLTRKQILLIGLPMRVQARYLGCLTMVLPCETAAGLKPVPPCQGARGVAATCGPWGSTSAEMGRWRTGGDRGCPLRFRLLWPGRGPDVAPRP
jgi:hypothetical protein